MGLLSTIGLDKTSSGFDGQTKMWPLHHSDFLNSWYGTLTAIALLMISIYHHEAKIDPNTNNVRFKDLWPPVIIPVLGGCVAWLCGFFAFKLASYLLGEFGPRTMLALFYLYYTPVFIASGVAIVLSPIWNLAVQVWGDFVTYPISAARAERRRSRDKRLSTLNSPLDKKTLRVVERMLLGRDPQQTLTALEILARCREDRLLDSVVLLLEKMPLSRSDGRNYPPSQLRAAAVSVLAATSDPRSFQALAKVARQRMLPISKYGGDECIQRDAWTRDAAIRALSNFKDLALPIVGSLIEIFLSHDWIATRQAAISSAYEIDPPCVIRPLIKVITNDRESNDFRGDALSRLEHFIKAVPNRFSRTDLEPVLTLPNYIPYVRIHCEERTDSETDVSRVISTTEELCAWNCINLKQVVSTILGDVSMKQQIRMRDGETYLIMVKGGEVICHTWDMSLPHAEFVRRATGQLPEGAWVGTASKIDGEVVAISSKHFFGYQLPAPPEVFAAVGGAFV